MRKLRIIYLLSLIFVLANGLPKFGDKIKKDDRNSTLTEVVLMSETEPKHNDGSVHLNNNNQNDRSFDHNNNNNDNKGYVRGQTFQFKYSKSHSDSDHRDFGSNHPQLQHRTDFANNQQHQHQEQQQYDPPHFSSFDFDFPKASASGHYDRPIFHGPPAPPPPPPPPQQPKQSGHFEYEQPNYGSHPDGQHFFRSEPSQSYRQNTVKIDPEFSFHVPQGFPHPQNDPRANFKKELMGKENNNGKPWGEKMSYTYRDPKNPNNYMEMSEVTMTVNKQMDPQEAASQVQKFLAAAQSGNYGPFGPQSSSYGRNHNYGSGDSQFDHDDPHEPSEPKFPNF